MLSANLEQIQILGDRKQWISDLKLKWSPCGKYLAVGTHESVVDLYDVSQNYKRIGVCKGHSSFIAHLGWSKDSKHIFTNSGDYELMYWTVPDCLQIKRGSDCADVQWAGYTGTLGFPVTGIWHKGPDGTDVNKHC